MGFNILMSLVGKNLKMFFRSKVSSSVVILVPFLIMVFAGFSFDSSGLSNIQVGVYSESYSDFTNSIISDFTNDGFSSDRYPSPESCIESVKHSESQICVIFPKDLNSDVSTEEILFYADYSRVNLVGNLINKIQKNILIKTSGVGEDIAQRLINSLESVKTSLPEDKTKIDAALDGVRKNKDANSKLEFPTEDISLAINDLEKIEGELGDDDISLKTDIGEIIEVLKDIEAKGLLLSSGLEDSSEEQNEIISKLSDASNNLNTIIVSLNSYKTVSADNIVSPIETRIEAISTDSNSGDYIIPTMLSLIALFGAILLSSTFVLKERKTKAFFRNFMAPVSNVTFIVSIYLTCLIILLIQFVFIFVSVEYFLDMNIVPILGPLAVTLFIAFSTFIMIGLFIGYLFRSDETVIFSSMIIAALLLFFSNIILPLENIAGGIVEFLKFNPLVVANLALRKIILFNFGFGAILDELLILSGFFIVLFVLNCTSRNLTKRVL